MKTAMRLMVVIVLSFGLLQKPSNSVAQSNKPNIIFIIADDLDTESMDHLPRLQSLLADRGTTFANFFVSLALCCPSRASILRGQYAHNTEIFTNDAPGGGFQKFRDLGREESTIATWLRDAGYRTALIERTLEEALDQTARRGVIVVAAAGNQGTLGSTAITCHPWVIPVVGYDLQGRPMNHSNLGSSIGRRGLGAPGDRITSLGAEGKPLTFGGTSAAAPFVTGAIALLWSEFPTATATEIKLAATHARIPRRTTVVPPLLDAWAAYQTMRR